MKTVYYNGVRIPVPQPFLLLAACVAFASYLCARPFPAQSQTLKTAAVESHEGLAISAQPWLAAEQYKPRFPKKSPLAGGILGIEVTFRNESDESIRINLDHIRLALAPPEGDRQELPSLSPEEVADGVLHPERKNPSTSRVPLPIPLPRSSGGGHDKKWTELAKAAEEAAVPGSIVPPHKTLHGLLYFDMAGQFDLLNSASLYVPDVSTLENNRVLTFFEIRFNPSSAP